MAPMIQQAANASASTTTIVDPTGVPARIDTMIPISAQQTERTAEQIVTDRKLRKSRIADSAGKITNAEIRSDPTRFMASTMITAMTTAISRLYASTRIPDAFAKLSSNVTAKILL